MNLKKEPMKASCNKVTLHECWAAIQQTVSSPGFDAKGPHLASVEERGLRRKPVEWPEKPVFSPYATTHDHCSQTNLSGLGYLMHRISVRLWLKDETASIVKSFLKLNDIYMSFSLC